MKDSEQRKAAREFIKDWTGRGDEKQETQSFWRALLGKVFGVEEPEKWLSFELPVLLSHTSFIDAYIEKTGVLIEQKGKDIDLKKGYKQSDGSLITTRTPVGSWSATSASSTSTTTTAPTATRRSCS